MAILLHKLTARAPRLSDAHAVTRLLIACDSVENGLSHFSEGDILAEWQMPGFNLATDAWAIITAAGQFAGFASTTWDDELVCVRLHACVHPGYRGRGVGTLLLRLAEVRARQYAKYARPGLRVALRNAVSHANQPARDLLEGEGYTLMCNFWRIIIEIDDTTTQSGAAGGDQQVSTFTLTFDNPSPHPAGTTRLYDPHGRYVVRQYDVYEKELRAGITPARARCPDLATV